MRLLWRPDGAVGERTVGERAVGERTVGERTVARPVTAPQVTGRTISVGVDVGGTFTDLVTVHQNGEVSATKVITTPDDRSRGVMHSVNESAVDTNAIARFVHGTTVVTNLLLERAGTRVVLLATAGFTDLLWLRRQERASLYDLTRHHRPPLVVHNDVVNDVIAVHERVAPRWFANGQRLAAPSGVEVLTPLTAAEVKRVVQAALATGANSFAIALLHSHVFADHERQLRDALLAALPEASVATSHEVLPEIREYERTATTVVEAYARPAVRRYMQRLSDVLTKRGIPQPRVMTSAGGTLSVADARMHAASLALSGPAGGVTAAAAWCRVLGVSDALTIDIGGTSADVGLVVQGEPLVERGGDVDGIPIALPRVLVETVAAGGGSIARVDEGGALHAGPESAGALPGPACYQQGGERATITDAHVALNHIGEGAWSGAVHISKAHAVQSLLALSQTLGRSVEQTAHALIATADATMARALRRVSVERGLDPRELALVAFGGGGPLHACGLADALGMRRVIIPPFAGVLSALGLALAPERHDAVVSLMQRTDAMDDNALHAAWRTVAEQSLGAPAADTPLVPAHSVPAHSVPAHSVPASRALESRAWARVRYVGQGHELEVPLCEGMTVKQLVQEFQSLHGELFGFAMDRETEVISVRVALEGEWWPLHAQRREAQPEAESFTAREARNVNTREITSASSRSVASDATRNVARNVARSVASDATREVDVTDNGSALSMTVVGPRTIRLPDATLRVADGWTATALAQGGWQLERSDHA